MRQQCIHHFLGIRKRAFGPKDMEGDAIVITPSTCNNIDMISFLPCSLLLRVHPLIALDGIYDSAAPKIFSDHARPSKHLFRIETLCPHAREVCFSPHQMVVRRWYLQIATDGC